MTRSEHCIHTRFFTSVYATFQDVCMPAHIYIRADIYIHTYRNKYEITTAPRRAHTYAHKQILYIREKSARKRLEPPSFHVFFFEWLKWSNKKAAVKPTERCPFHIDVTYMYMHVHTWKRDMKTCPMPRTCTYMCVTHTENQRREHVPLSRKYKNTSHIIQALS
jgi:hypothetical protein